MPNKSLAERYLDAWNSHDTDRVLSFFTRNATYIDSGLHQQVRGNSVGNHVERILDICPDARFEMLDGSAIGNGRAVIQWRAHGHNLARWCPTIGNDGLSSLCGLDYIIYERGKLLSTHVYFDLAPFLSPEAINPEPVPYDHNSAQYQKSGLTEQDLKRYQQQLTALMQREQLYLENELTLSDLADALGISTNHLSQVINSQFQLNFYELLAHFRIERAKQLIQALPEHEKMTSLDIAFESGFGSSSAFYRAFQRHTRLTPTEYRKRYC